jgi:hypothetical protein
MKEGITVPRREDIGMEKSDKYAFLVDDSRCIHSFYSVIIDSVI